MHRRLTFLALLALAACSDQAPPRAAESIVIDSADLAGLPELTPTAGTLLCTADGYTDCPLGSAYANRVSPELIAIWEPGRTIRLWGPGDTVGTPLPDTTVGRPYRMATAIAGGKGDNYRIVTADPQWQLLVINTDGEIASQSPITVPDGMSQAVMGYVGDRAVRQIMTPGSKGAPGILKVVATEEVTDTTGVLLLEATVEWLTTTPAATGILPPLVASMPLWALAPDGGIVWSPGSVMTLERRDAQGRSIWRVEGPPGTAVTTADLDAREKFVRELPTPFPLVDEDLAYMRSQSDSSYPAVTMLMVAEPGLEVLKYETSLRTLRWSAMLHVTIKSAAASAMVRPELAISRTRYTSMEASGPASSR